jgi:hypothetical protein
MVTSKTPHDPLPGWNPLTRMRQFDRSRRMVFASILSLLISGQVPAVVFTDVTLSAGINHVHSYPEIIEQLPGTAFFSGGAAAGDFDGDGLVDLVFTRLNDTDLLYRNLGNGTFEARSASAGFIFPTYTDGVISGDVDNDGDLDLYMTSVAYTRNYLYLNNGSGIFVDAGLNHPAALANGVTRSGQGASFGDFDKDGYLDLVTGDWGNFVGSSQSRLLRNLGTAQPGSFQDVTVASGINTYRKDRSYRYAPRFVDLDRDGNLDVTFAADFVTSQIFWSNGDGTFTDGTIASGTGTDLNGMGSTFGDYDNDGDLDWFITNITNAPEVPGPFGGWNRLYRNDGNRTFTDVTQAAGVRDSRWSWGTTFFDYDNDGDLDLTATNGYNGGGWRDDQTFIWRNDNGVFTDVSDAIGVTDTLQGRSTVHLDYDSDGDLDLLIVNNAAEPILYRNDGGNANHYLRIDPRGTVSNPQGIGAWITVTPDLTNPQHKSVWEIDGGSGYHSQNERIAHFGLGASAETVDQITIEWPSGIIQHLYDVPADQTLVVTETLQRSGDYNGDGLVDAADYSVWRDKLGTNANLPGDETLGSVTQPDYVVWSTNFGIAAASSSGQLFTIPEPATSLLFYLAVLTNFAFRVLKVFPRN